MVLLLRCFAILLFSLAAFAQKADDGTKPDVKFDRAKIEVGTKILNVEIAEKTPQHERGLMFREKLASDDGMLFIFPVEQPLYFWMKNTVIDLSIGYFDKDGILVDTQEMKATSVMYENPPNYPSKKPAMYALEMNKGWFAKNHVKIGAKLKILKERR